MKSLVAGIAAMLVAGLPAQAAAVRAPHIEAELITERIALTPGPGNLVGLRLKMEPNWHTYWINAGDSGMATSLKWSLPPGFTAGPILWPYPDRIAMPPLTDYGYSGEIVLPVEINVPSGLPAGKPVTLRAVADWLVCEEICIPGRAELEISLPVRLEAGSPESRWTALFAAARARRPASPQGWRANARADGATIRLTLSPPPGASPIERAEFFPETAEALENSAAQPFKKTADGYELTLKRSPTAPPGLAALSGVLVSDSAWGSETRKGWRVELPLISMTAALPQHPPAPGSFWPALLLAFMGGILLNLMPCVLPVLALKVLGLARDAAGGRALRNGLLYTLGVLLAFWTLAGLLLALRAGGSLLGWGFQMQSPAFIAGLALFFTLFALNLLGVFEVGTRVAAAAGRLESGSGGRGALLSGVLATFVATPCTAPFMGTALGVALTLSAPAGLAIFTALGLGMAFPYLLLSAWPAGLKRLPKPGPWLEKFKALLGFSLLATVLWLLWVFGVQRGVDALVMLLAGLLLASIAGWLHGRSYGASPARKRLTRIAALLFLLGGAALAFRPGPAVQAVTAPSDASGWQPWSAARVEALHAAGTPVFVDFTAAWCLSCQVNERVALDRPEVEAAFRAHGIVKLKADWTNRDEEITRTLAAHGRAGVPLYLVYGRDPSRPPETLPAILTPSIVIAALDRATKPAE